MDVLKAQLERLQKQLAGLTASQKMLTGALIAIMLMTLLYWGKYAGESEMEPVTSAAVAPEELDRITSELAAKDIKAVVTGDKVMVPADRKLDALSALSFARVLPKQDKAGFETMLDKMNPFMAQTTDDAMFNRGKEITVGQIVSGFPGVSDAQVMIDPTERARIGDNIDASATVTITMREGTPSSQQLVNAAADVVQGAQAGLKRSNIKVVVDGTPHRVQDTDSNSLPDASDQIELQQKAELRLADKVKDQFQYINGLMVSVTVKLTASSQQQHQTVYDPKAKVVVETQDNDQTTNTTTAPPAGEPGPVPNVGQPAANAPLSVGAGGGGGTTDSTENHQQTFQPFVTTNDIQTSTPAGETQPIAATVRVPMSHFVEEWQRLNPSSSPGVAAVIPTQAQLAPLEESELPTIKDGVIKCVGLTDLKDVSVEPYTDLAPLTAAPTAAQASMSMPLSIVTGHVKEIALGGLAVMSLFVVSMMVRKSAPMPIIAAAIATPTGPITLATGDVIAGSAGDGAATLDGMELDDDAVRAQQMLEQVSTMVKENPESAASLVKRWLNRT